MEKKVPTATPLCDRPKKTWFFDHLSGNKAQGDPVARKKARKRKILSKQD